MEDMPENLVILLCISGSIAGGLSPMAPTGIIGVNLAAPLGLRSYTPIFMMAILTFSIHAIIFFFIFGGWKLKKSAPQPRPPFALDTKQVLTLTVISMVIFCVLILKFNLGLTSFTGAAVLLLLGVADQDDAIANVAWGTLLLICGVSMLVNVIAKNGGISLMSEYLAKIMTPRSATSVMNLMAGLLSSVSSASGVVMPTLLPTVQGLMSKFGVSLDAKQMIAAIMIGAHAIAYSPLSTMGGIGMAVASKRTDKQKLFSQLLFSGVGMLILTSALFLLGIYNLF
jgi:Na+/H+ antiporter NhaD/arsenite permease-like protein